MKMAMEPIKSIPRMYFCYSCRKSTRHSRWIEDDEHLWICTECSRCLNKDGGDDYCQKLLDGGTAP